MKLRYRLNSVWLETNVRDAYVLGALVRGYCNTKGVKEIQVYLDDTLVMSIVKD